MNKLIIFITVSLVLTSLTVQAAVTYLGGPGIYYGPLTTNALSVVPLLLGGTGGTNAATARSGLGIAEWTTNTVDALYVRQTNGYAVLFPVASPPTPQLGQAIIYGTTNAAGAGLVYAPSPATPSTLSAVITVQDAPARVASLSGLRSLATDALQASVGETNTGGLFTYTTAAHATNSATIIEAVGKESGRWVRQYSGSLNVRWFGADPSASATANRNAISNAICAAHLSGSRVLIPGGNYAIDGPLMLYNGTTNGYAVDLVGEQKTKTILTAAFDNGAIIDAAGIDFTDSLRIRSRIVDIAFRKSASQTNITGIACAHTHRYFSIENVDIVGLFCGVWVSNLWTMEIRNPHVQSCGTGLWIASGECNAISIFGGEIHTCGDLVRLDGTEGPVSFFGTVLESGSTNAVRNTSMNCSLNSVYFEQDSKPVLINGLSSATAWSDYPRTSFRDCRFQLSGQSGLGSNYFHVFTGCVTLDGINHNNASASLQNGLMYRTFAVHRWASAIDNRLTTPPLLSSSYPALNLWIGSEDDRSPFVRPTTVNPWYHRLWIPAYDLSWSTNARIPWPFIHPTTVGMGGKVGFRMVENYNHYGATITLSPWRPSPGYSSLPVPTIATTTGMSLDNAAVFSASVSGSGLGSLPSGSSVLCNGWSNIVHWPAHGLSGERFVIFSNLTNASPSLGSGICAFAAHPISSDAIVIRAPWVYCPTLLTPSATASTDLLSYSNHGLTTGDAVYFTGGTVVGPTPYWVYRVETAGVSAFYLTDWLTGLHIDITTSGTLTGFTFIPQQALRFWASSRNYQYLIDGWSRSSGTNTLLTYSSHGFTGTNVSARISGSRHGINSAGVTITNLSGKQLAFAAAGFDQSYVYDNGVIQAWPDVIGSKHTSGTTTWIKTRNAHGLSTGDVVLISGTTSALYDVFAAIITFVSTTEFRYSQIGPPDTSDYAYDTGNYFPLVGATAYSPTNNNVIVECALKLEIK